MLQPLSFDFVFAPYSTLPSGETQALIAGLERGQQVVVLFTTQDKLSQFLDERAVSGSYDHAWRLEAKELLAFLERMRTKCITHACFDPSGSAWSLTPISDVITDVSVALYQ